MDALLSTEDAATLAAARTILYELDHAATMAGMQAMSDTHARPGAFDLGRVAEAASAGRSALSNVLVTTNVYGKSDEAGAVL